MAWMPRLICLGALICSATVAHGQVPPSYGFDFVTIGAPGNRHATQAEAPDLFPPNHPAPILAGGVDYEYRISRTETTVSQWFEFVDAYWSFASINLNNSSFLGFWIRRSNPTPGQNPGYYIIPGAENRATDPSWHMAARYCNWLHNGKVNQAWAFETGVYDTSTFTQNPNGSWNDQLTHSPGARYWIPTLSEWTKGMYYDPNKHGPGQEGYWRYSHSSDSPPVPGWPWAGGETSAGLPLWSGPYLDVGSYPWAPSPWGLLDGSGSESEWTEWMTPDRRLRANKGTEQFFPLPEYYDRIDYLFGTFPNAGGTGFRIASSVPAPGSACMVLAVTGVFLRRRRT